MINDLTLPVSDMTSFLFSTTLVLTLLYAPYTLLLRKERFFRQNRFTLLAIMVLSLVLPFCDFHALYPGELLPTLPIVEVGAPTQISATVPIESMVATEVHDEPFRLLPWLCYLYIVGAFIALTIRLWQFVRMYHLLRRDCLWSDVEEGITIHCHADNIAPCSWMHHIVISEHDYRHHRHEILLHEQGHVLNCHSWDILLLMLVQTIQWYNPFVYMLGDSLRDVHEYEADDYVLRQGVTVNEYQTLLLKTAVGVEQYTFANSFNHRIIKNRITMLKRKCFSPWTRAKVLFVLPSVLIAVIAISCISPKEEFPYPVRIGLNDVEHYNISDFGKRTTILFYYRNYNNKGKGKAMSSRYCQGPWNGMPNPVEAFLSSKSSREELLAGFQLTEADIDSVQIYFPGEFPFYDPSGENGVLEIHAAPHVTKILSYKEHIYPRLKTDTLTHASQSHKGRMSADAPTH